jgi:hypothetical protein
MYGDTTTILMFGEIHKTLDLKGSPIQRKLHHLPLNSILFFLFFFFFLYIRFNQTHTELYNFGAGPRMCVGSALAEEEVHPYSNVWFFFELLTVPRFDACALLCQRYSWRFATPQPKELDDGGKPFYSPFLRFNFVTLPHVFLGCSSLFHISITSLLIPSSLHFPPSPPSPLFLTQSCSINHSVAATPIQACLFSPLKLNSAQLVLVL